MRDSHKKVDDAGVELPHSISVIRSLQMLIFHIINGRYKYGRQNPIMSLYLCHCSVKAVIQFSERSVIITATTIN